MSTASSGKPVVAAFDFDGTLTRRDTLLPFLRYLLGTPAVVRHALVLSPTLIGYGMKLIRNDVAKERVLSRCLAGMEMEALRQQGESFAALALPNLLRHESLQRLAWHQQQGHRCVVISASLDLYVRPWAEQAGVSDIIATHLETAENGRITGKFSGGNCFGAEKVRRLQALLGERDEYVLYAYGDSRGDRELLALADHAYYRMMPAGDSAT